MTNEQRQQQGPEGEFSNSELERALFLLDDYELVKDMWIENPEKMDCPYKVFAQIERAYEQLQTLGVDVSGRLRQTRVKIIRSLHDMIYAEIGSAGLHLLPDEGKLESIELSFPYLKRAVNLLEEYTRKVDSQHPSLTGSVDDLEITPIEEKRK
jgi:hypothetical protein